MEMKGKPKALLVEYELMERTGFQVEIIATAEQALQKSKYKHAIILMDVGLPDKTGIEATYEIHQKLMINILSLWF